MKDALLIARGYLLLPLWLACFPFAYLMAALGLERGMASERFTAEQLKRMRREKR